MHDFASESSDSLLEEGGERFFRTQSYFDKSITIRLLIGLLFAVVLFFFFHVRQPYVESLELGVLAERYVVAQIDFAFPDEEATIILKQEAAHEIGVIWRIKEEQINQKVTAFQKYITQNPKGSEKWEAMSKETSFANIALALSLFSDNLSLNRFTDVRTIQRIDRLPSSEIPIPTQAFYPFLPAQEAVRLPLQFWTGFAKRVFSDEIVPGAIFQFIVHYFETALWEFEMDQGLEYTLRKVAQGKISEKFTRIRAGERLIDQGEKVTSRHLAMMQAMKEKLHQKRNLLAFASVSGSLLMTLVFLSVGALFLRENHKDIFFSNRKLALLTTILSLAILLTKVTEVFLLKNTTDLLGTVRFALFVPFVAILIASLIHARIASFSALFLAVVYSMGLAVATIPFLVINILVAMVAILTGRVIRRRKDVFIICGKAWLASIVVMLAFDLYDSTPFANTFLNDLTSTFLFMAATAVLVVGLLPMFESTFQIMTDITLMEFMDPSNEILRRLTIEAPGTYQHSLVVGHLSESAAAAIGANALFCRVATQYHDIGKLINPQYFTENQLGGVDMHQLLTPFESTQVIIAHVSEGVALARKVGLPEQFIDIIKEHHGTTLVYYFYHKQLERVGDKNKVDTKKFRYAGPKPRSKESTIIMIADTLEAASRCLDLFNEITITDLVEKLIAHKMEDGQFDESLLTFEELGIVKNTLVKTLLAASHPRIKYPPHHPGEEG
jgi:cyclic-di-AMP phosphodiesterase PgpH